MSLKRDLVITGALVGGFILFSVLAHAGTGTGALVGGYSQVQVTSGMQRDAAGCKSLRSRATSPSCFPKGATFKSAVVSSSAGVMSLPVNAQGIVLVPGVQSASLITIQFALGGVAFAAVYTVQ